MRRSGPADRIAVIVIAPHPEDRCEEAFRLPQDAPGRPFLFGESALRPADLLQFGQLVLRLVGGREIRAEIADDLPAPATKPQLIIPRSANPDVGGHESLPGEGLPLRLRQPQPCKDGKLSALFFMGGG